MKSNPRKVEKPVNQTANQKPKINKKRKNLRVIVAGSRDIFDYDMVEHAIKASGFDIGEIVSGGAIGVDKCGEFYAERHNIPCKIFQAKWNELDTPKAIIKTNAIGKQYNARAGFDRNVEMAKYADALVAITNGSKGTEHMIKTAQEYGLQVYIWEI